MHFPYQKPSRAGAMNGKIELQSMISLGEAARRLNVSPTTLQRLADAGTIDVVRTSGGHRRISLAEIQRYRSEAGRQSRNIGDPLLLTLLSGDLRQVLNALRALRAQAGSWAAAGDRVARSMTDLGQLWASGQCLVFEEHTASEALRRATLDLIGQHKPKIRAKSAILLPPPKEQHVIGSLFAELVLVESGWKTLWIGNAPPAKELAPLWRAAVPDLIVASASTGLPVAGLRRFQERLELAANSHRIPLVLGGSGSWSHSGRSRPAANFVELAGLISDLS